MARYVGLGYAELGQANGKEPDRCRRCWGNATEIL